ncbi:MAG: hypothetical protein QOH96_3408 [Blastocatellia bacterium]|nr:hypothetical protein [Blastocatellia bacterium]
MSTTKKTYFSPNKSVYLSLKYDPALYDSRPIYYRGFRLFNLAKSDESLVDNPYLFKGAGVPESETMTKLSTYLAVLAILIILALGIWYCFPYWDDAWLYLFTRERGSNLSNAIPDRRLVAMLMEGAWCAGLPFMILISLSLWAVLGFLSARLQMTIFPSLEGYGPLCVVLTVSPVLAKCPLAVFNVTSTALLAIVVAYLGFFAIYSFVTYGIERYFSLVAGLFLFGVGILISEYAIPCALITIVLLLPNFKNELYKRSAVTAVGLLTTVMAATYLFTALHARSNTNPMYPFTQFRVVLINLPFTLSGAVWQSLVGAYIESLGYLSQVSLRNKPALLFVVIGFFVSTCLYVACRKSEGPPWKLFAMPIIALIVGLLPMCLMYRIPYPNLSTRFFMPVTPLASALFVSLLSKAFTGKLMPTVLVGLISVAATGQLTVTAIRQRRALDQTAEILKPEVANSSNLVIAVVPFEGPDYALTGQIARHWPIELEQRFWAISEEAAASALGPRDRCNTERFTRDVRLVERAAPVDKVLLVGSGWLEPYCK